MREEKKREWQHTAPRCLGNFDLLFLMTLFGSGISSITLNTDVNAQAYPSNASGGSVNTLFSSGMNLNGYPYNVPTCSFSVVVTAASVLQINFSAVASCSGSLEIRAVYYNHSSVFSICGRYHVLVAVA